MSGTRRQTDLPASAQRCPGLEDHDGELTGVKCGEYDSDGTMVWQHNACGSPYNKSTVFSMDRAGFLEAAEAIAKELTPAGLHALMTDGRPNVDARLFKYLAPLVRGKIRAWQDALLPAHQSGGKSKYNN